MAKQKECGTTLNLNYVIFSVVFIAVMTLLVLYMPNIREIDGNILHSIRLALSPYPAYIPAFISDFGGINQHLLWPQITACSVLVSHKKFLKAFLLVVFVEGTYFLSGFLKNFVCRARPEGCTHAGFSFPSIHASVAMCFLGILIYLVNRYVSNNLWRNVLIILFGVWIFLICISRLWLGVHFPIDVLTGAVFGFMMVNLYIILIRALGN